MDSIKLSDDKKNNNRLMAFIIAIETFIIVAMAIIIVVQYQDKKAIAENANQIQEAAEEAMKINQEAAEEDMKRSEEYYNNLKLVTSTMLSGASNAEECCNLIQDVWNNAIWEKEDISTDKYTKPDGDFVSDFNDAINNLFADSDFFIQINNIKSNQDTVNSIIIELKNPPDEYKSAYESLSECYDTYLTFTNLAINPTGSLNTFSDNFKNADDEFLHRYQVMQFYLQD